MKAIVLVAAMAALTACNQQEAAPAPEATEAAAATPTTAAAVMAADGKPPFGNFRITTSDGEEFMEEVKADGTYVSTQDGEVVETGRWVQKTPNNYCYTNDEEGSAEECNTEQVDENGVWTTVNPEGETATVVRVEA